MESAVWILPSPPSAPWPLASDEHCALSQQYPGRLWFPDAWSAACVPAQPARPGMPAPPGPSAALGPRALGCVV
ncbi:hypothetical protein BS50DRAFT_573525 [Corynespora cassiicola Philippines]|uniref:Uncharacterized protein n=1 Tax=Corynespora cassiicola Philippines TaxID=1448308 RepID=A0A2T2NMP9_CORCC|nr:hypothetical protein BS50DRAFT_573525 [Corynespora cassiicola Philippines]